MKLEPKRFGPYRVVRPLGRGGMGVVYLASREADGEAVAVKTLRTAGASVVAGMRREVLALARMQHPGVVHVVAEGMDEDPPWYAMELLTGRSLRQHYRHDPSAKAPRSIATEIDELPWWDTPVADQGTQVPVLSWQESQETVPSGAVMALSRQPEDAFTNFLTLCRRLCDALAFVHGEGIVHRDLKPDNVLVRSNGHPVLIDFGLIATFGADVPRETISVRADACGTPQYMAPEQVMGQYVDGRADLYSLGCILYEFVTGRTVFRGRSPVEILRKQVYESVVPPATLRPEIPPALDSLILRLLEKAPARRIGHAHDVGEILGSIGAEPWTWGQLPPARPCLYRPSFVGRAEIVEELVAWALEIRSPDVARMTLVSGEAGIGKTRTVNEMRRLLRGKGIRVLLGGHTQPVHASGEALGSLPLEGFVGPLSVLCDFAREWGPDTASTLFDEHRARVLAPFLPELGTIPGVTLSPESETASREHAVGILLSVVAAVFAEAAELRPVLLVIDDLHWADELTLAMLDYVQRSGVWIDKNIQVLGIYRSDEAPRRVAALAAHERARHVDVGALADGEAGDMVRDMLGGGTPQPAFLRFLTRSARGNPFTLSEYVRLALDDGVLQRDSEGRWDLATTAVSSEQFAMMGVPGSLDRLFRRRIRALSDAGRRFLEALAVIGVEAPRARVRAVARLEPLQAFHAEDAALREAVLEVSDAGVLRFGSPQMREVVFGGIAPERSIELHSAAADVLHAEGAAGPAVVAQHLERGGRTEEARTAFMMAARVAADRYLHGEAHRDYARVVNLAESADDLWLNAQLELVDRVLLVRGQTAEARDRLRDVLDRTDRTVTRKETARAFLLLAGVQLVFGELDAASVASEESMQLYRDMNDKSGEAAALEVRAQVSERRGEYEEALDSLEAASAVHRAFGRAREAAGVAIQMARVILRRGDPERARSELDAAVAVLMEGGDRSAVAAALVLRAEIHGRQGATDDARRDYNGALEILAQIGDRRAECEALRAVAVLEMQSEHFGAARVSLERAIAGFREIGDRAGEARCLSRSATLERLAGHTDAAEAQLRTALEVQQNTGDRTALLSTLLDMGAMASLQGDFVGAERQLREAREVGHAIGSQRHRATAEAMLAKIERDQGLSVVASGRLMDAIGQLSDIAETRLVAGLQSTLAHLQGLMGYDEDARRLLEDFVVPAQTRMGDTLGLAASRVRLGDLCMWQGSPREAEVQYRQALAGQNELGAFAPAIRTRARLWHLYRLQGQREKRDFEAAMCDSGKHVLAPRDRLWLVLARSRDLLAEDNGVGALGVLTEADGALQELPVRHQLEFRLVRARACCATGDTRMATEDLGAALRAARSARYTGYQGRVELEFGRLQLAMGFLPDADRSLEKALTLLTSAGDAYHIFVAIAVQGVAARSAGRPVERYVDRAREQFARLGLRPSAPASKLLASLF